MLTTGIGVKCTNGLLNIPTKLKIYYSYNRHKAGVTDFKLWGHTASVRGEEASETELGQQQLEMFGNDGGVQGSVCRVAGRAIKEGQQSLPITHARSAGLATPHSSYPK